MKKDQQFKILKMVEEGVISAEQGRRLLEVLAPEKTTEGSEAEVQPIEEQDDGQQGGPQGSPGNDAFGQFSEVISEGWGHVSRFFNEGFSSAAQQVRDTLGISPQNLTVKFYDKEEETPKYHFTTPIKLFKAFKGILTQELPFLPQAPINWKLVYENLERAEPGKIFEGFDKERETRVEVWVE